MNLESLLCSSSGRVGLTVVVRLTLSRLDSNMVGGLSLA